MTSIVGGTAANHALSVTSPTGLFGAPLWAVVLVATLVVGAAAFGGFAMIRGRRRRGGTAHHPPPLSHDSELSSFLYRALGELAQVRIIRNLPVPDLHVVFAGPERIVVHFAEHPNGPAIAPFRASPDGMSWTVESNDLTLQATAHPPFPTLVSVGSQLGWQVLLDVEQAPGLISLIGDPDHTGQIAHSLALELANSPWSREASVTMVGFADDLSELVPGRIRSVPSLSEVLPEAERFARRANIRLGQLDAANIATGRLENPARSELCPQVYILAAPPEHADADRVARIATDGHSLVSVVCLGDSPYARWRFQLAQDGELDMGTLGFRLRPHQFAIADYYSAVPPPGVAPVGPAKPPVEIIPLAGGATDPVAPISPVRAPSEPTASTPQPDRGAAAQGVPATSTHPLAVPAGVAPEEAPPPDSTDRPAPVVSRPPSAVVWPAVVGTASVPAASSDVGVVSGRIDRTERVTTPPESSPDASAPARPGDLPAPWLDSIRSLDHAVVSDADRERRWPAAVDIALLGPITITAPGPVDSSQRPFLTELVTAAVLHPEGLPDAVLRSCVARRGAGEDLVVETVSNLQTWLGSDADGQPRLRARDGRWEMAQPVRVDWTLFRALAAEGDPDTERARLVSALSLVRGPLYSRTPLGRYGWEAVQAATVDAQDLVISAARRAAALATAAGDMGNAEWALRMGLLLLPRVEELWRDLLSARAAHSPSTVSSLAEEMRVLLSRANGHTRIEPETAATLARLIPGTAT